MNRSLALMLMSVALAACATEQDVPCEGAACGLGGKADEAGDASVHATFIAEGKHLAILGARSTGVTVSFPEDDKITADIGLGCGAAPLSKDTHVENGMRYITLQFEVGEVGEIDCMIVSKNKNSKWFGTTPPVTVTYDFHGVNAVAEPQPHFFVDQ